MDTLILDESQRAGVLLMGMSLLYAWEIWMPYEEI